MALSRKWKTAKTLLRFTRLDRVVIRLYPIATSITYKDLTFENIQSVQELLVPSLSNDLSFRRIGDSADGGYVLIDDFRGDEHCLSFGVGGNWSFDLAISELISSVDMFDHTVEKPGNLPPKVIFHPYGISEFSGGEFVSVHDVFTAVPHEKDIVLKIDIEGAEWEVLGALSGAEKARCKQIIVEYHNLHEVGNQDFLDQATLVLKSLNESHFLVNLHANNWAKFDLISGVPFPDVIEVTYYRKERGILDNPKSISMLSDLNTPNNPQRPEHSLSFTKYLSH
jgi:hypothetical protein